MGGKEVLYQTRIEFNAYGIGQFNALFYVFGYYFCGIHFLLYRVFPLDLRSKWVGTYPDEVKTAVEKQVEGRIALRFSFNGLDGVYP